MPRAGGHPVLLDNTTSSNVCALCPDRNAVGRGRASLSSERVSHLTLVITLRGYTYKQRLTFLSVQVGLKEGQKERRVIHLYQGKDTIMTVVTVIVWLIIGLIAGFLASRVMRGGGYGVIGDIVVGIIGAFIGGWLASLLGLGVYGLIGSIIVAFIGACILIAILRAVSGSTRG